MFVNKVAEIRRKLLTSFKQFILKGVIITLIEIKFRYTMDLLTI